MKTFIMSSLLDIGSDLKAYPNTNIQYKINNPYDKFKR